MNFLIEKNLIRIIAFGPFVFIPFVTIFISYLVIHTNHVQFEKSIQDLESSYITTQENIVTSKIESAVKLIEYKKSITNKMLKEKVKTRVDTAYSVAKNIYEENKRTHSPREIQKMITDSLRPLIWNNGESFIFILDFNGVFHLAPEYLKHLEGKSVINFQDATQRYVIREEINLVRTKGDGYLWDTFTRPGCNPSQQFKQLAYVKNFGVYDWYIGSAEYLDTTAKEMEKSALETIQNAASHESEYFFAMDEMGTMIMSGQDPTMNGKNFLSLKDSDGKEFVKELIRSANSDKPYFVSYKWKNPKSKVLERVYSYGKKVPNSHWIIGSGFYKDALDETIKRKQSQLYQAYEEQYQKVLYSVILLLIVSLFISYRISMLLKRTFAEYSKMIEAKNGELIELNHSLEDLVEERTNELSNAYERMKKIAVTDTLTKIYNRYFFNDALKNEIHRASRYGASFSLCMFDIDHFKYVNDIFGHDAGDKVLVSTVNVVKKCLRESDIFARTGGEEFMIILPETGIEFAREIAERIRKSVKEHNDVVCQVTISIGLVSHRLEEDVEEILKRVDIALYRAKDEGRNRVVVDES